MLTEGCECTTAQVKKKKSVQKPQNKGPVRSWQDILLQSGFIKKKEFVLYLFYSVTYGVSSNKISRPPTLCSSLSPIPFSSFSAYIFCNMIQRYPMMHFLPWPTFAPTTSCGRASRPVFRFYLGCERHISDKDLHKQLKYSTIISKDVSLYLSSTGGNRQQGRDVSSFQI